MNKLTIAFIVITIVVVAVLGTLLGLRYFGDSEQEVEQIQTQTTQPTESSFEPNTQIEEEAEVIENVEEEEEEETVADFPQIVSPFDFVEPEEEEIEQSDEPVIAMVDILKIADAGFKIPGLVAEDFLSVIFKEIDLSEYDNDNHSQFIVTEADEFAGTITELIFGNEDKAIEVYESIKTKITNNGGFVINETNQYGESSFFANHNEDKNSVFLVVKKGERLYTLYYPAKNHNKMKNLINLL